MLFLYFFSFLLTTFCFFLLFLLQKNFLLSFLQHIRMSGKNINFDNKKSKEVKFYKNKNVTRIDDIDVNKILVSKKEPYGTENSF